MNEQSKEEFDRFEKKDNIGSLRGSFIVIEGTDGAGKATQAKLLVDRLKAESYQVEMIDFPQYGNWSARFVEKYLRGEFGTLAEIGAKKGSLFYALDRYAAGFQIRKWLEEGINVISNRYVSSNKGHQLGKINDYGEKKSFLDWLNDLEYNILGIPVPDLTLFLHMPAEIGQMLVDKKEARAYVGGKKKDIHESDIEHLKRAEQAYLFCFEHDKSEYWQKIICSENNQPRSIEAIHEEVYNVVSSFLMKK